MAVETKFAGERGWFQQARFGVFIHFGLYTLLGENENTCRNSWTPLEYERQLMPQFNPAKFNADDWVRLIQDGGATYLVLTTKHGEGFCLWNTRHTRFNVTNTPFKRDIVGELAEACHRHGMRLGLYFASDNWHYQEPGEGTEEAKAYPTYVQAQLRELLTQYGQVDEIWFDGQDERLTIPIVRDLIQMIHTLQPSCVVDNRAVDMAVHPNCLLGDFATPERVIPDWLAADAPFIECCDAMGLKSWGYHSNERFWSTTELLRRLSQVACLGGNYLLNIEPQADGVIRPECAARLKKMGQWINAHRSAIFGPTASPLKPLDNSFDHQPSIGCANSLDRTIYLHLHQWPNSDQVLVKHVAGQVTGVKLIGSDAELQIESTNEGLNITNLPDDPPPHGVAVIQVDFAQAPTIDPAAHTQAMGQVTKSQPGETIRLLPEAAIRYGLGGIPWPRINRFANGNVSVGYMISCEAAVKWEIDIPQAGEYEISADLGTAHMQKDAVFQIEIAGQRLTGKTVENGWYDTPARMAIGRVKLPAGRCTLDWTIVQMPRTFSDIHAVILQPVK